MYIFFFVCLINFNYKYIKILSNLFFILLKYLTLVYDNINLFIIYNKCFDYHNIFLNFHYTFLILH